METIKIQRLNEKAKNFYENMYKTKGSAGFDLAYLGDEPLTIKPNEVVKIETGLKVELSPHTYLQIHSRSGLATKNRIVVANNVGIIDNDFRGELIVVLTNFSNEDYVVKPNDRVAQAIVMSYIRPRVDFVDELNETERGEGGFGSTGN